MPAALPTLTRRGFVVAGLAGLAGLTRAGDALAALDRASASARYLSRPDLTPPAVAVRSSAGGAAGYVFVAPFTGSSNGAALIVDDAGEPVWIHQSAKLIMNFRAQQLDGKPVLTWWEGTTASGFFAGECVIADTRYSVLKRFEAGNGFVPEVHEFLITPQNTALVSINNFVPTDLTPYGGPAGANVIEGVIQELDIDTGGVLLEWHSLDHVGVDESPFPVSAQWDYLHLNSIGVDPADDNLIVSARYPSTIYKLDRRSGDVLWRLGGTKSDFALGDGAAFWFQHDARAHPGGLLSVFDDGADSPDNAPEQTSRGLVLRLDTKAMTAEKVAAFPNPGGALTVAMGSAQVLANGGMFVGWGTVSEVTEFAADGSVVFDATFPGGEACYRAFRSQWPGNAHGRPAIAVQRQGSGADVYASWNGSTRVSHWRVLGGRSAGSLASVATGPRTGFETRIGLASRPPRLAVAALDANGKVLATSEAV